MFDPELGTTTWISWSWSMPEACAIANELPRTERQFDLVFDWVPSYHPSGHRGILRQ
jgi:hypothetical protein